MVHTTISGYATLALSVRGLNEFVEIIAKMERPVWVSDSSLLTDYERAALSYGRNWFSEFKKRGGSYLVVVSDWSIAIMAGRAMGLGFGVKFEHAPTLRQAMEKARRVVEDS